MLLRLITVISLFTFLLLLISNVNIDIALYRSILVFMLLFAAIYLMIFFLNVVKKNPEAESYAVAEDSNNAYKEES